MKVEIYTDGACSKNGYIGARGGWAYIILIDGEEKFVQAGYAIPSTNQRMELMAAIEGLIKAKELIEEETKQKQDSFMPIIKIYTDSAYLCNCYNKDWWSKWLYNDWMNSKKEPVANKDLWLQLIPWFRQANVEIIKVKGHSDNKYNNYVDIMAKDAVERSKEI